MKQGMKRGVALFMSVVMLTSATTISTKASEDNSDDTVVKLYTEEEVQRSEEVETELSSMSMVASGKHGENLFWNLYEGGTLVISGDGAMVKVSQTEYPWYVYKDSITSIQIMDTVTKVETFAFQSYTALKSVTMPVDCDWAVKAFDGCTNVKEIHYTYGSTGVMVDAENYSDNCTRYFLYGLPYISRKSLEKVTFEEGITHIGDYAFRGARTLTTVKLPSTLTSIGQYAFYETSSLSAIELPNQVSELGRYCFYKSGLVSIDWASSLTEIPQSCFYGTAFEKIEIPGHIKTVGASAFEGCANLKEVCLKDGVSTLGKYAFKKCTALTSVTMPVDCNWKAEAFVVCTNVKELHYTWGSTGVMLDGSAVKSDHTRYYGYALPYYSSDSLETVTFQEGITRIGDYAFYGAKTLKNITLPSTLKSIGENAFYGNSSLIQLIFIGNVPHIGDTAFTSVTATMYYPASNEIWNGFEFGDYGGNLSWVGTPFVDVKEPLVGTLTADGTSDTIAKVVGSSVTLNASAAGGSENYTYKYAVLNVATGNWYVLKDFSSDATYTTKLSTVGTKQFAVTVKDSDGVTVATNRITIKATAKLAGSLQADGSATELMKNVGDSVTLNATATGGSGSYTYKFAVFNEKTGSWFVLQDFSSKSTYTSALKYTGVKQFAVTIKDSTGATVATNRVRVVAQELSATLQIDGSTSAVTKTVGSSITLEALATGGTGDYTYKFAVLNADTGTWAVLKDFSADSICDFVLKTTGNKVFVVTVKDSNGDTVATNRIAVTVTK